MDGEKDQCNAFLVLMLSQMLDQHNKLVKTYRYAKQKIKCNQGRSFKLKLIKKRSSDPRIYNLPHVSEVAALVVGDFDINKGDRDIIVEYQKGGLQRISELHPLYLALQYPLLFPFGEDGYRDDLQFRNSSIGFNSSRKKVSMRQYFAYRFQMREQDESILLLSGRLFQQLVVDGYSAVERQRIDFFIYNQPKIRAATYNGLHQACSSGAVQPSSCGKRVILPSSFIGGRRHSKENYQDAMTICHARGYPSLFITFTCNPKWPELVRLLDKFSCSSEDRPDLVVRIFKIKLDQLIRDITKEQLFGPYNAGINIILCLFGRYV